MHRAASAGGNNCKEMQIGWNFEIKYLKSGTDKNMYISFLFFQL